MPLRRIAALFVLALAPIGLLLVTASGSPFFSGDDNPPGDATSVVSDRGGPEAAADPLPTTAVPTPTAEDVAATRAILERPVDGEALFEDVTALARDLSRLGFVPLESPSLELAELTYEEYRAIEYRTEAAVWSGETPFEVQLFYPGFLYTEPVQIHLVADGRISNLPFDPALFAYGSAASGPVNATAPGYAGFRIHYPLNDTDSKDEIVVFLGASYFRLLGPGHAHGLSSRGIAVNIGEEAGEEFPTFRAFWLVKPAADAGAMTFFALLDGPSVTGAYRFRLEPGAQTGLEVEARLFARRDVLKLGVAPLTSMFLYNEDTAATFDDYRPAVHDSDGLMMHTSWGEWIWRPLTNRSGVQVTALVDETPRGFGLVQRERDFESYLDLEAQYHRRPSEWVSVGAGDWGTGGVELLELPTLSEFNDNIVAYWVPDEPLSAGQARRFSYRLETFDRRLGAQALAHVERTRIGRDALPGQANAAPESQRRFVIDFAGGELDRLSPADTVTALLVTSSGEASEPVVQPLPDEAGLRATFTLRPSGGESADMRLFLEVPGRRVSETWSYLWIPEPSGL